MIGTDLITQKLYIDGEWVYSQSGETREIVNPFNRQVIARVEEAGIADARAAVQSARHAFDIGEWPRLSATERGRKLLRISELLEEQRGHFAQLETLNTGKTLTESLADMDDIANVFRYFAGLADKAGGEAIESPIPNSTSVVVREPIGVCVQITPWNYPLLQAAWKVAPAMAAGCTIVLKPSELTPLTALELAKLAEIAGIPKGVFNVVTGPGQSVGAAMSESEDVDLVSFTGGGETGRKIMRAAAGNFKRIALELGGKNPNIVFADSDFETAVDYARMAEEEGASLVMGGKRPEDPGLRNGYFFEPTLFVDCDEHMRVVQEETFGPILTVERFTDEEDAVRKANNTVYGLAGAVWTNNSGRAQRMSHALRLGAVWINDFHPYFAQAPWGGYKQSGIGRELGVSGLEEYTEQKHIFHNNAPEPMNWFGV